MPKRIATPSKSSRASRTPRTQVTSSSAAEVVETRTSHEPSHEPVEATPDLVVDGLNITLEGASEQETLLLAELAQKEADHPEKAHLVAPAASRASRGRAPASAPPKGGSIYDSLVTFGLLRKVTDIVLAKVAMPWHLREDAAQEVQVYWAGLRTKPNFERNQVARYAYLSGQHAALKLRRTIGAVVTIPGALFRTGRDTAFMEAIGAAVNPKDVDDYRDSLELSVEAQDILKLARVSPAFFEERFAALTLSAKQRKVAYKTLVERKSAEDVSTELEIPLMYVERLLNQVTAKLHECDDAREVLERAERERRANAQRKAEATPGVARRRTATQLRKARAVERISGPSAGTKTVSGAARPAKAHKPLRVSRTRTLSASRAGSPDIGALTPIRRVARASRSRA